MKAIWKTLLCILSAMLLLGGCRNAEEPDKAEVVPDDTEQVQQEEQNMPEEEPAQGSDDDEEQDLGALKYVDPADYVSAEGIELDPGTYIAVVGKAKDGEFWKKAKEGAAQAISDLNEQMGYTGSDKIHMTYDAPSEEEHVEEQINVLDELLGSYPDAVCMAVVDVKAFEAQIDYMVENSIQVVAFDSGIDNDNVLSLCATDNEEAAAAAAIRMCELINGEGQIAVLMHNQISETGIARESAFLQTVREKYPKVEVVKVSYLNDAETEAAEAVRQVLEDYPELKGYFASNSASEAVVRQVCAEADRTDIRKVSFDGTNAQINALRSGDLDGTMIQNPYAMGYTAVMAAARAIMEAEELETSLIPFVNTGCMWADTENLEEDEVQQFIK